MVQNKDIEANSLTNGDPNEFGECSKTTNGVHEPLEESEEEDDYLDYLLVVPSLDRSVENRNMSLISESLMNFYAAIENRKEYQKIKEELMDSYVVPSVIKVEKQIQETIVEDVKETIDNEVKEPVHIKNEVMTNCDINDDVTDETPAISQCILKMWKSTFVPEIDPSMYDQFFVCRRCKIFFKTRKFRKMHNVINHRRKKKEEETIVVVKPKRVRIRATTREPLICDLCSKSFKIKALLRSHMNCHLSEKLHQCTQCNYASKRYNDLKKHNDVHHNPDRVRIIEKRPRKRRCKECQEVFADKLALRAHKRLSHRKVTIQRKLKVFKSCEKCEEVLYSKKSFIVHMKEKHPDTLTIKCETCNRKFKTNFRLKKHKSRYEFAGKDCRIKTRKVGDFICQKCDTKFSLKSHLSLHMRKHQNLTCEQCKIEFKSQLSLKYHQFSHLEIEPKCSHCEKIFTSEQTFANHLKRKSCMLNGLLNGHAPEILIA